MPAAYPTPADLVAILPTSITVPDSDTLQGFLDEAVQELEQTTGHNPFLAGAAATRRYTPSKAGDHILQLDAGLVSVSAVTYCGTALTLNTDYWLKPDNAAVRSRPYTHIQFRSGKWTAIHDGETAPIAITGVFGFGLTVPQEIWEAVRCGAAWKLTQSMASTTEESSISEVIKAKQTPQARIEYAVDANTGRPLSRYRKEWERKFKDTIRKPRYCLHWAAF